MLRKIGGSSYTLGFGVASIADALGVSWQRPHDGGAGRRPRAKSIPGTAPVRAGEIAHGTAGDAHARASGKMLLSMVHPSKRERYFSKHNLRKRRTPLLTRMSSNGSLLKRQSIALVGAPERCVHVGDRESDIYEFYCTAQDLGACGQVSIRQLVSAGTCARRRSA
ncbi:hypothetical protein [Mesorhizobium amorphae]|uniref:hypothetical protein n=1 Tax=Mesorhizobium amorphae TaxID=71433 RepID=UPI0017874C3C|nr:hypothetical protein [Mesorhizobium amorphae]